MLLLLLRGKELDFFKRGVTPQKQNDDHPNLRMASEIKGFDNVNVS